MVPGTAHVAASELSFIVARGFTHLNALTRQWLRRLRRFDTRRPRQEKDTRVEVLGRWRTNNALIRRALRRLGILWPMAKRAPLVKGPRCKGLGVKDRHGISRPQPKGLGSLKFENDMVHNGLHSAAEADPPARAL